MRIGIDRDALGPQRIKLGRSPISAVSDLRIAVAVEEQVARQRFDKALPCGTLPHQRDSGCDVFRLIGGGEDRAGTRPFADEPQASVPNGIGENRGPHLGGIVLRPVAKPRARTSAGPAAPRTA